MFATFELFASKLGYSYYYCSKYNGEKFKLNDVVSSFSSEETRRDTSQMSSDSSQTLAAGERGRSQQRDDVFLASKGMSQAKGRSKSRGRVVTCWYCKKQGHMRNDCNLLKSKRKGKQVDGEASIACRSDDGVILSIACMVSSSIDTWVLDFGASFHICRIDYFSPLIKRLIVVMCTSGMIVLVKFWALVMWLLSKQMGRSIH